MYVCMGLGCVSCREAQWILWYNEDEEISWTMYEEMEVKMTHLDFTNEWIVGREVRLAAAKHGGRPSENWEMRERGLNIKRKGEIDTHMIWKLEVAPGKKSRTPRIFCLRQSIADNDSMSNYSSCLQTFTKNVELLSIGIQFTPAYCILHTAYTTNVYVFNVHSEAISQRQTWDGTLLQQAASGRNSSPDVKL